MQSVQSELSLARYRPQEDPFLQEGPDALPTSAVVWLACGGKLSPFRRFRETQLRGRCCENDQLLAAHADPGAKTVPVKELIPIKKQKEREVRMPIQQ
jgi:hypothetical protein